MQKGLSVILSGLILLSGQAFAIFKPMTEKNAQQVSRPIPINNFTQVSLLGTLNVKLHTGYAHPKVVLQGDARDVNKIKVVVNNEVLQIKQNSPPKHGSVLVTVYGKTLRVISYKGAGAIEGRHIVSKMLDVNITNRGNTTLQGQMGLRRLIVKGSGTTFVEGVNSQYLTVALAGNPVVQVKGVVNLTKLDVKGQGWFGLYWVKSHALIVRATHKVKIQLAGIVNRMDVELWDKAIFKGRYLRAKEAFVKTHGNAVAELTSVQKQHTLALDDSDIRFYNRPPYRTDFMGNNGAVLDMVMK
jgi:hypothetical protein